MNRPRPQAPDENEGAFWDQHGDIFGFDDLPSSGPAMRDDYAAEGLRKDKEAHALPPQHNTQTMTQGKSAGTDANAGHDSVRNAPREITGSSRRGLNVKYMHEMPGLCSGNIIWAERDRGDAYYRVSQYAMRAGRFPANHPCCPNDKGSDGSQMGMSESICKFRAKGYWASCFPEGDGITLRCLNGQSAEQVIRDITECFGWQVNVPVDKPIPSARELHFRAVKVKALVSRLRKEGKERLAASFTEQEWLDLAHRAGARKPSPTSRADVIGALRESEEM